MSANQPPSLTSLRLLHRLVQDHLECPVCCQTPRQPPIYQCDNGHLICGECRPRMKKCPQGQCLLEDRRNLLAEQLLDGSDLPRSCKHSGNGCPVEDRLSHLQRHESQCEFREVPCPDLDCDDDDIQAGRILRHLVEEHYLKQEEINQIPEKSSDECLWVVDSDDFRVRSISGTWPVSIWKYKGKVFFSMLKKQRHEKLWYAWLYVMASPEEATSIKVAITASPSSPQAKWSQSHFQYKGFPHAVDTPESEIISSCAALVITDESVGSIITEIPHDQRKATGYFDDDELKFLFKIKYSVIEDVDEVADKMEENIAENENSSKYVTLAGDKKEESICD